MNGNGRGNASRGRLGLLWAIAVGVHIVAAIVGIRFVREVGYWGVSPFSDVQLYHSYASLIAHGSIPFLHFSLEYPPLAIPCFVVPLLFVEPLANGMDTSATYIPAFAVEMMLIDAVVVWLLARAVERTAGRAAVPAALAWYTAYFVVLCPLVVARFDLAATLVAFAAATNLDRGRWRVGGVLAGVGVLVKFVPGVVIVPLVAGVAPRDAKIAGVQAMTWVAGVGVALALLLGGNMAMETLWFHVVRGIEIGSTYASAYMLSHELLGTKLGILSDHGCMNVLGSGSKLVARSSIFIQLAGLAVVGWRARRLGHGYSVRLAGTAFLAFMVGGKVISPQYMIWLMPFVAASGSGRRLFLVCCVLTTAVYPWNHPGLCGQDRWAEAILLARNVGLIWLLIGQLRVDDRDAPAVPDGRPPGPGTADPID